MEPSKRSSLQKLKAALLADTPAMSAPERRHATLAALLGITVSLWAIDGLSTHAFWLLAPMGASAVILFGMAKSPVAQPWPVIGGYLVACIAGLIGASLPAPPSLAAGIAVGLCLWLMARLNCIHPPGGALALLIVLDQRTFMSSVPHTLALVASNVGLLLCTATMINNLIPGRRYPFKPEAAAPNTHGTLDPLPLQRSDLNHDDLTDAIRTMDSFVDVREDELVKLYNLAIDHAFSRHVGLRCADVMSRDLVTVRATDTLAAAWRLLQQHQIKALPVIDGQRKLVGIVTLSDFFREAGREASGGAPAPADWLHTSIAQVMTTQVFTAAPATPMADLVREVARTGRHHVPVVDQSGQLIGLLTQSDMIAALYRRLALEPAALGTRTAAVSTES